MDSEQELRTIDKPVLTYTPPLSAKEIKSQADKILEVMKSVMKEGIHY